MLKKVHYGGHAFEPWFPGAGYVDVEQKSLKSFRSREPRSIWQSLSTNADDLGTYELYICPHCLTYTTSNYELKKHVKLCIFKQKEIGKLVYEDEVYKFMEIRVEHSEHYTPLKLYLQNLCLLGHLFLKTKSICFTTNAFYFYVAIHKQEKLVAGFFSKEIESWHNYNLACIITFPPFQKTGLGRKMIRFSYWLSKFGGNGYGSPEKPLSKFGELSYRKFWIREIQKVIYKRSKQGKPLKMSLKELATETGIDPQDLVHVLPSKPKINIAKDF